MPTRNTEHAIYFFEIFANIPSPINVWDQSLVINVPADASSCSLSMAPISFTGINLD